MRNVLVALVLPALALALAPSDFLADFEPALLQQAPAQSNETVLEDGTLELLKRQAACATGYSACTPINQPGLCCRTNQICSADGAGHPACCPSGAACTGTIGNVLGGTVSTTPASGLPTATSTVASVSATTTGSSTDSPFIQTTGAANSAARSTVSNAFYPFPIIATTYTNAAACSAAYTGCQSDAASCTNALASGQQGVTISAPNGGVTVTAIASIGSASAQSICASLSSEACSGLQVAACTSFDLGVPGAAATMRCRDLYGVGAGLAVGLAGQLLR